MFNKIDINNYNVNIFKTFKLDNAIAVFGSLENHNGLSIGWGTLGTLWSRNVATVYVKPTRYSFEFANSSDYFSIIWFDESIHKKAIKVFGTLSGRDVNKDDIVNLNPLELDNCTIYKEAKVIITLKKISSHSITKEEIFDKEVYDKYYSSDNLIHSEYIGEVIGVYVKN